MVRTVPIIVLITLFITSCASTLPKSEVDTILSCPNTELKVFRKNLLMKGFTLSADEKEFVRTQEGVHPYILKRSMAVLARKSKSGINYEIYHRYGNASSLTLVLPNSGTKDYYLEFKNEFCTE